MNWLSSNSICVRLVHRKKKLVKNATGFRNCDITDRAFADQKERCSRNEWMQMNCLLFPYLYNVFYANPIRIVWWLMNLIHWLRDGSREFEMNFRLNRGNKSNWPSWQIESSCIRTNVRTQQRKQTVSIIFCCVVRVRIIMKAGWIFNKRFRLCCAYRLLQHTFQCAPFFYRFNIWAFPDSTGCKMN